MRRYFSATEYKLSPFFLFLPSSRGKLARTLPMGRFLLPFTNFTRSERREISSLQEERGRGGGKEKEISPNRGILDQRLVPEGNHIFREETTASSFFSYLPWAAATADSSLPFPRYPFRFPSLSSSGKSPRTYRRVFPAVFLRHILAGSGSDCRQDLTRD